MFFHPRESESKLVLLQFLFKKYLEYEKSVGDEERIESVKRKAIEYVESSMAWPLLCDPHALPCWWCFLMLLKLYQLSKKLGWKLKSDARPGRALGMIFVRFVVY